ncbi:MAG TPA: V-type ATP synthase subunit D [Thermoplasmata archaeon]|nr:V-type ATP synthase subunit D [Thermoplasmata archaeon]
MVIQSYKPTRSQLLLVRRTKRTAERGHRLLKLKRDALIVEFFRVLDRAKKMRSNLVEKYRVAERRIAVARAVEGAIGVRSAAFARLERPTLDLKTRNVMGISVPRIEAQKVRKNLEARGYGIVQTSARIDEAAEAYEDLVENIIVAAEIETTMRRLIEEIEKVKRRVNALEYRVIPELKSTEAWIRQRLDEMERDNFMRLKHFKQVAETRAEDAARAA